MTINLFRLEIFQPMLKCWENGERTEFRKTLNCESISTEFPKESSFSNLQSVNYSMFYRLLLDSFKTDPCEAKPCEGGATCIPRFGTRFFCLCPPHRTVRLLSFHSTISNSQGSKCENDVDECDVYSDGPMGCQNNATCENVDNGFMWVSYIKIPLPF